MTDLLLRIFVKDHNNTGDPAVREAYGKFAGTVGILSNAFLCTIKIIIGLISGSIAIVADGINNLADALSSAITLVGFRLSAIPEDRRHPYGHAMIEYVSGLIISIVIIFVGIELFASSVDKVIHPVEPEFSYTVAAVLAIAIVVKVWQARFNIGLGKRIDSLTLIATGTDSRNDVISTAAVLVSMIITEKTGLQLDGYMGCAVALFIIWSGISLVKETASPLLGEAPDDELVRNIAEMAKAHKGVLGIHDLMVHNYGPGRTFASLHVEVDAKADIMESHDMIDNIEKEISEALNICLVIHLDPVITDDPELNYLKELVTEMFSNDHDVSGIHDFRIVRGPTHTNVIFDAVICMGCEDKEDEIREKVQKRISEYDPSYFTVITFDTEYSKQNAFN